MYGSKGYNNITRKNTSKNSLYKEITNVSKEQERQWFLANVKKGVSANSRSIYKPNSETNYKGEGDAQTRTAEAMKRTSNSNRFDRLLLLFKGAVEGSPTGKKDLASIDIGQYVYALQENPTTVESKKDFIKIMESLEAFPKDTPYDQRIAMLTPEFIKTHGLEHIGMKKEKTTEGEKGQGKNGINVQKYSEYSEEELNRIIKKFKQTTFDDVLGLFIILTMYLLSIITTGDRQILYNATTMNTIIMLIYNRRQNQDEIARQFSSINLNKNEHKRISNAAKIQAKKEAGETDSKSGLTAQAVVSIPIAIYSGLVFATTVTVPPVGIGVAVLGSMVVGIAAFVRGIALITAKGGLLHSIKKRKKDIYQRFYLEKNKITAGGLLTILYVLLTQEQNEEFANNTEINFQKNHYTFLKEFKPMFSGWYTETELYNFIFLFTRERLKESLGNRYNHVREIPEGWHEIKNNGETYYNSDEYSKKEESPLNRYKLVSWIMPMVPFVNKPNYNENIIIYPPSPFSHGPQTPVAGQGQVQQAQVSKNSGVPQAPAPKKSFFSNLFSRKKG